MALERNRAQSRHPMFETLVHPEWMTVMSLLRPVAPLGQSHLPAASRPDLASGVQLLGESQGSGYAQTMWLVQFHGRFIQLTELLYRVAEYCDGTNTLADIAAQVSWTTEWQINADDVEFLLTKKLIPTGLVSLNPLDDDEYASVRTEPQSVLRLGLRTKMIGPKAIEPIAKRLQYLFLPAFLIPMLIAGALAHAWLYFDRGIGGAISHAVASPGLLLLVVAVTVVPAVWHEFGHASALRYGGGRARSIGVGIYIMDPAFYTDVTDSYRLSKAARIRTGFGGVYFDMILSTIMIIVYYFTGWQTLIILVILSNLNTIHQFIPLIRLDGYWILADLTGVPDFFSLIGPYLRSVLPLSFWKGPKLPELKRGAKITLGVYTMIGIPGMIYFLYLFASKVPTILTTSAGAIYTQSLQLFIALYTGSWLTAMALQAQILILSATVVGMFYFIFIMSRTYLTLMMKVLVAIASRLRPRGAMMRSRAS